MPFVLLVLVLLWIIRPAPAEAQDVVLQLTQVLGQVEQALAESFGRSLPLPAASPGVAYSFDPATGNFRREPVTFGQVYLDRADPLGARRLNVSFAYQYVQLASLEGHDADDLSDALPIPITDLLAAVQIPTLDLEARVHQFLFALTYGIGEHLDVSLAVPVVYSDLRVRADVVAAAINEGGELIVVQENIDDRAHVVGAGDVQLRAKYRFFALDDVHLAAGLLLRIPTGDEGQLQGIGFLELAPALLASTRTFQPASWARLQGHFNTGIGFNTDDVNASEARWGLGLDWGFTEEVTAAVAVLGRHQFARVSPLGSFDFPRCDTDLVTCASDPTVRTDTAPLFGLSGDRPDYYNVSIGGRAALWRDSLFAFVNVAIPLNDGFVRTEPIPLIGVEGTF